MRRAILAAVTLLAACSLHLPPPESPPDISSPAIPPSVETASRLELEILDQANAARTAEAGKPLREHAALRAAAVDFAAELAHRQELSHVSDVPGRATLNQRMAAAGVEGWRAVGENLARVPVERVNVAAEVIRLWLRSPGHRSNLLQTDFNASGTGVAYGRGYWYVTQVYAQLPSSAPPRE